MDYEFLALAKEALRCCIGLSNQLPNDYEPNETQQTLLQRVIKLLEPRYRNVSSVFHSLKINSEYQGDVQSTIVH